MDLPKLSGLDLFTGIGGITLALSPWVKPVAYCENDPYAQSVLLTRMHNQHLPYAPIWDDVRTLSGSELPVVDIIYGGFPCTDISYANTNGAGLGGKRSGLFFEIVRLAQEIQPNFIFLENVPAIRTRGASTVGKELADLGYDCRWHPLSAQEVGANHVRNRWFLLAAHADRLGLRYRGQWGEEGEAEAGHQPGDHGQEESMADPESDGRNQRQPESEGEQRGSDPALSSGSICGWWETEPAIRRVVDGLPNRVDRLRALGNAVVPTQARQAFKELMGL